MGAKIKLKNEEMGLRENGVKVIKDSSDDQFKKFCCKWELRINTVLGGEETGLKRIFCLALCFCLVG